MTHSDEQTDEPAPIEPAAPLAGPPISGPVPDRERVVAMDALRGVALCGILLINIPHMGITWDTASPLTPPSEGGADWVVWWISQLFVEGTMRGLFGLLFGAGAVLLFARGATGPIYYRRSLWLIVFGLIHGTLLMWPGEILFSYGLAALFLFPIREAGARSLIAASAALYLLLCIGGGMSGWEQRVRFDEGIAAEAAAGAGEELSDEQNDALADLADIREGLYPPAENLAEEREARLGGLASNIALSSEQFFGWQVSGGFTVIVLLENLATMMLGMALAKMGAFQSRWSTGSYAALVAVGYGVGLPLNAFEAHAHVSAAFTEPVWHEMATYQLSRVPTMLGHVGLFMLAWRAGARKAFAPFAALGRMALSNYLAQSIIAAIVFFGFGFGLWGQLGHAALWGLAAAILIAQAIVSMGWLSEFRFGPAEWLWRSLTYVRAQPMLRPRTGPVPPRRAAP